MVTGRRQTLCGSNVHELPATRALPQGMQPRRLGMEKVVLSALGAGERKIARFETISKNFCLITPSALLTTVEFFRKYFGPTQLLFCAMYNIPARRRLATNLPALATK